MLTWAPEERPGIGIAIASGDAEFFDGVLGLAQHAGEGVSVHLVVVVDAVEGDVALVGAAAVDRAAAAVIVMQSGQVEHAGLQGKQVGHVAGLAGQRLDLRIVRGVAERGVGGIEGLGVARRRRR